MVRSVAGEAGSGAGKFWHQRNVGLDTARALAILMVVVSHIWTTLGVPTAQTRAILETVGQAGVELFFSLSGFLIGGILIRLTRGPFNGPVVLRFIARRWFRTLPLYFVVLITLGWWFDMDVRHSLMLIQNFFPAETRALPVSWSLVMEEYFYLAFPAAMLLLTAVGGRGAGLVLLTASSLIVTCSGLRLWNAYGYGPDWPVPFVHENPLLRLDCAAYGVLGAWIFDRFPVWSQAATGRRGWGVLGTGLTLAGLTAIALVWVLSCSNDELVAAGFLQWGPAFLAMQPASFDLAFAVTVVGWAAVRLTGLASAQRVIMGISLVSYSTYLLHLAVIGEVSQWDSLPTTLKVVISVGLTSVASIVSYRTIERPFLTLRDRILPAA